jgi:hypothetical protein
VSIAFEHDHAEAERLMDCEWCTSVAGDRCKGGIEKGRVHNSRMMAYRLYQRRTTAPVLPYAGTSGYSGSDTSESRARTEDAIGTTQHRQQHTLHLLASAGIKGLTVHELCDATGWHHGQASAALTNLHRGGRIARLTEKRARCKVYVSLTCVARRNTEPPSGNKGKGVRTFEHGHLRPVDLYCVQDRYDRVWVVSDMKSTKWMTAGHTESRTWGMLRYPLREVVLTWTQDEQR